MNNWESPNIKRLCITCHDRLELSWKWDGRFGAALGEFTFENKEKIIGVLQELFKETWTIANVSNAPQTIQSFCATTGGLRTGQMLFSTDSQYTPLLLVAWWPWGGGKKISIRIAAMDEMVSEDEFKDWFGINSDN